METATLTILAGAPPEADVATHGARRMDAGGHPVLVFTSSVAAVRCALALDRAVGVHTGEVQHDGRRVTGGPIAVARALATAASAREVLVSALVRDLCDGSFEWGPPLPLDDMTAYAVQAAARPSLRLVLADDHVLLRDGLAALLSAAGQSVVGTAADGTDLIAMVRRHAPDVVVIDIRMPPTHSDEGLVAAEQIRAEHPGIGVLLLSQHAEPTLALRLLEATGDGGAGYLLKERVGNLDLLLDALHRIAAGDTVIDPSIADRVAHLGTVEELTQRELEVLALIAQGRSNQAIAEQLFVTRKTVESHVSQIFLKLGLRDSGEEHRRVAAVLAYLGHPH